MAGEESGLSPSITTGEGCGTLAARGTRGSAPSTATVPNTASIAKVFHQGVTTTATQKPYVENGKSRSALCRSAPSGPASRPPCAKRNGDAKGGAAVARS